MKVCLLTPSVGCDAEIQTPVVRLFVERMSRQVDLHVFALHHPPGSGAVRDGDVTLHQAGAARDRFSRRMARTIASIRREHQQSPFDLLHALWLHEPGTIAVAAGALLRLPVVASVGGAEVVALPDIAYGALRQTWGRLMTANVLQHATLVTAGSAYAVRKARRIVPHRDPTRFRRAPLPVDAERFAPSHGRSFDAASPRLLHAASLIPVKDQTTLLRAFRRVVDVFPGAQLTIASEDPLGHRAGLEHLQGELSLGRSVTFIGPRPHASMAALYHDSDLFVLSSRHESQAMVVLEAAAAGVPTVGASVGVVPELAPEAAIAVRPRDAVALADAVIDLLADPIRLQRMGRQARARVLDEYAAPVVSALFLELYSEAIERSRR